MPVSKYMQKKERKKAKKRSRARARVENAARAKREKTVKKEEEEDASQNREKNHEKEEVRVYYDSGGNTLVAAPNASGGNCALLTLLTQWMLSVGIPYDTVFSAYNGKLTKEIKDKVQWLRMAIVDVSDGHLACSYLDRDGTKESRSFEEVVQSPEHIETKEMWDKVMRCAYGHVDGRGVVVGAQVLGLDGFRVVSSDKDGKLLPVDGRHDNTEVDHMALHHSYGHWEALVPLASKFV